MRTIQHFGQIMICTSSICANFSCIGFTNSFTISTSSSFTVLKDSPHAVYLSRSAAFWLSSRNSLVILYTLHSSGFFGSSIAIAHVGIRMTFFFTSSGVSRSHMKLLYDFDILRQSVPGTVAISSEI